MAIIQGIPGIEVGVKVDNQPTIEYVFEDDEVQHIDNYSLVYIESQPDSSFSVVIRMDPSFTTNYICPMAAHVYVDGTLTNRRTFPVQRITQFGGFIEEIRSAEGLNESGNHICRGFQFGKTEIGIFTQHPWLKTALT
jgi:hypothetical protein